MVAVAAAKFETLASTKNTLAPLRVRDLKIKTKKICQKNKNCYLASMNQSQFHQNVAYHYAQAAKKKRFHQMNQVIETIQERKNNAEQTAKKHFVRIAKGAASKKAEVEYYAALASLDALDGLLYDTKKIREEIFSTIDELAYVTEPQWNGRESLREEIDRDKMLEILADTKKRE